MSSEEPNNDQPTDEKPLPDLGLLELKMITNTCWVRVWEHKNYGGSYITIYGPSENSNITGWKFPGGGKVGDYLASIVTGPGAWCIVYEDEGYGHTQVYLPPSSLTPELSGMLNQIGSYRLYNSKPPEWLS